MELVAQAIGMDPLEFRKKNLLQPGSTTLTGEVITEHTGNPLKCLEEAATAIGYGRLTAEEAGARAAHRPEDRQGGGDAAQGAGHAVVHRRPPPWSR